MEHLHVSPSTVAAIMTAPEFPARDRLIELLWRKASEVLFITREQFVASLDGWEIDPIEVDGELAFVTVTKGAEFHFDSLGTGHKIPLGVIRERIGKILDEHGYVTTKAPKEDARQRRINTLFGCTVVAEDEYDFHYRLERSGGCPL